MHYTELKKKISELAKMKDGSKVLEEVRKLDAALNAPKFQFPKRGYYNYVYQIQRVYDTDLKRNKTEIVDRLGSIDSEVFEANKDRIKAMGKAELKQFILAH